MIDDTIRTRAISYTRTNWKMVIAYFVAAVSTLVNVSIAMGHKQADGESLSKSVDSVTTSVNQLKAKVDTVALTQAEMNGTLKEMKGQVQEVKDFKQEMMDDWKEGMRTYVPKFSGHRARKP